MIRVRVHEDVFRNNPAFRRGIVVARNMDNTGSDPELQAMLEEAVRKAAGDGEQSGPPGPPLKEDPRIVPWLEAHRKFGSNPNKFPPAHLSLLKRVMKPGSTIPFISKVVAVMNYCSITGFTPVGGDDIDAVASAVPAAAQPASGIAPVLLELRYADGSESFVPLDAPETEEHPFPGEVIYLSVDTKDVMCRRWNWRNGFRSRITGETRNIVMNIDAIGDGSEARAAETRDRVAELLARFCSGEVTTAMLFPEHNEFVF